MRILFADGHPVIDAAEIAPLLDLDVMTFRKMMQSGRILTRTEQGIGDDEGRLRLTLTSPSLRLRLTCAADGEVLKRSRVMLRPDAPRLSSLQASDTDGAKSGSLT